MTCPAFAGLALLVCCVFASAAISSSAWQSEQQFNILAPGIVKISLPPETLDKSRAGLEDLRLSDDSSNEVPYLIERPAPTVKINQRVRSFQVSLTPTATLIDIETGFEQAIDSLTLETPAAYFIKGVKITGTTDGTTWQTLAQGQPIFRQFGASQLRLPLPAGVWKRLQLKVDDQRTDPIPFLGAQIHATSALPTPSEAVAVTIKERHENPGETRLTLDLGAANLNLSSLQFETEDPLFTRQVTAAVPQIMDNVIGEQMIAQSAIYRIAIDSQPVVANLEVALDAQVKSRELVLLIRNNDSPPLSIKAVHAERRPVYLVFFARRAGVHHLYMGNNGCPAPNYDLAALGTNLKSVALSSIPVSPLKDNPDYRAPEVLPGVEEEGAQLNIADWAARKSIKLARPGAQEVELDQDLLAYSQSGFRDLRLMHEGKQVPYILEHTSITRVLKPSVVSTNEPRDPTLSRWILQLTHRSLPLVRLTCTSETQLFQRDFSLFEDVVGERGDKYRRGLGNATWVRTPGHAQKEFSLTFASPPETDRFMLETHNGDNPPINLENFQVTYPVTRILFKAKSTNDLFLYYDNPRVSAPRYDLELMASQLLAAEKNSGQIGEEDRLKKASWASGQAAGKGGVVFWGILGLVVVVLLVIISRLLPKPPEGQK